MTDEDFLSYIIANSDSTRELFNGLEIARMLRLAGYGGELADEWEQRPNDWREVDTAKLVARAKLRLGGQGVLELGDDL